MQQYSKYENHNLTMINTSCWLKNTRHSESLERVFTCSIRIQHYIEISSKSNSANWSNGRNLKLRLHFSLKSLALYWKLKHFLNDANSIFHPLSSARSTTLKNPGLYSPAAASPDANTIVLGAKSKIDSRIFRCKISSTACSTFAVRVFEVADSEPDEDDWYLLILSLRTLSSMLVS